MEVGGLEEVDLAIDDPDLAEVVRRGRVVEEVGPVGHGAGGPLPADEEHLAPVTGVDERLGLLGDRGRLAPGLFQRRHGAAGEKQSEDEGTGVGNDSVHGHPILLRGPGCLGGKKLAAERRPPGIALFPHRNPEWTLRKGAGPI